MNHKANPPLLNTADLPMPRLELRWDADGAPPPEGYQKGARACRYLLVMPLEEWDIRRENEDGQRVRDCVETQMRCTVRSYCEGLPLVWLEEKKISTPFRDNTHIRFDSFVLKIPAYVTAGEFAMALESREPINLPPYKVDEVQP